MFHDDVSFIVGCEMIKNGIQKGKEKGPLISQPGRLSSKQNKVNWNVKQALFQYVEIEKKKEKKKRRKKKGLVNVSVSLVALLAINV